MPWHHDTRVPSALLCTTYGSLDVTFSQLNIHWKFSLQRATIKPCTVTLGPLCPEVTWSRSKIQSQGTTSLLSPYRWLTLVGPLSSVGSSNRCASETMSTDSSLYHAASRFQHSGNPNILSEVDVFICKDDKKARLTNCARELGEKAREPKGEGRGPNRERERREGLRERRERERETEREIEESSGGTLNASLIFCNRCCSFMSTCKRDTGDWLNRLFLVEWGVALGTQKLRRLNFTHAPDMWQTHPGSFIYGLDYNAWLIHV